MTGHTGGEGPEAPGPSQGVVRVLVVDDDPRVRAALAAELAAVGFDPTVVGPERLTADADRATGSDSAPWDVALVDVALPSVTAGLALIADLAAELPVVALSINGAAREAALEAGATAYLEKDGDIDRLVHTLHASRR